MSKLGYEKPTIAEYEKAKMANDFLRNNIVRDRNEIMRLIDEIIDVRKRMTGVDEMIAHNNKIILAYELFKEMEANKDEEHI